MKKRLGLVHLKKLSRDWISVDRLTFVWLRHAEARCEDGDEEQINVQELNVAQVSAEVVADHYRYELGKGVGSHVLENAEGGDQSTTTCRN